MSVTAKVNPPRREERMPAAAFLQGSLSSEIRPIPGTFAEEILARRADLNQAWEHFLARRFEDGAASAAKLVDYLTSLSALEADDQAVANVLLASARVVLGCCCERMPARQDESGLLFHSAAQLFEEYFDKQGTKAAQDFRYYGLALSRIGQKREAKERWAAALKAGDTTLATYRLLAANCLELDELEAARVYIEKALALSPNSPTCNKLGAEIFDRKGDREQAIRAYQKAVYGLAAAGRFDEAMEVLERLDALGVSDDAQTSALRGWVLSELGRNDEALRALDQALKAEPSSVLAAGMKGQVLRAMDRLDEALAELDLTLELAPDLAWIHAERGATLRLLGRYQEALGAVTQALEIAPDNPAALGTKGQVLRALGRKEEALAVIDGALALAPDVAWLHAERGETLRLLGQYEDGLRAVGRALEIVPAYAYGLCTKGLLLRALGSSDEALRTLDRALELAPNIASLHAERGETLRMLGRYEEALRAAERALEIVPAYVNGLLTKGLVLRALGRTDEALAALGRAAELAPELAWLHADLGKILAETPSPKAAQQLQRALKLSNGQDATLWSLFGTVMLELGDPVQAREAFRRSCELDPDLKSRDLKTRVRILRLLDRDTEAMLELQHALESEPDLPWANLELGKILYDKDYDDEALEFLERALKTSEALEREPKLHQKALLTQGMVLSAIARYADAVVVLQAAIDVAREREPNPARGFIQGVIGWAKECLGKEHARAALEAYEEASRIDPANLWWLKGQANCLNLAGEREKAARGYRKVLEVAQEQPDRRPPPDLLSMLGWCHFRLGEYDKAIRLIVQSLSLKPFDVSEQFDLALVMLCAGRAQVGLQEYKKGVEMAELKPVSRRCGLYYVAQKDLNLALRDNSWLGEDSDAIEARTLIDQALGKAREFVAKAFKSHIERSIELDLPPNIVYYHLSQFKQYPKFMDWVAEVESTGGKELRWRGTLGGFENAWKVDILEQTPYTRIAWQSATAECHSCALTLFPIDGRTRLRARISFDPGKVIRNVDDVPACLAKLLEGDLNGFREFLRTRYSEPVEKGRD